MIEPSDSEAKPATADRELLVEQLVRISRGDRNALDRVYEATSGKLNAVLLRMLRDVSASEEVLQDVYLTVWRRSATYDPSKASPITWLVTIARNKAIDRLRANKSRGGSYEPIDEGALVDPSPSVVDAMAWAQERHKLQDCLERLESKHQAMIRSAFFDGLTYEALAQREGMPLGTVKSWIRRSLMRLRACMDAGLP